MSLFSSEIVRKEIESMKILYDSLAKQMPEYVSMTPEERGEFVDKLDRLLEMQEVLYTRADLLDDEESNQLKQNFREVAKRMGIPYNQRGRDIYRRARESVQKLKDHLDFDVDKS